MRKYLKNWLWLPVLLFVLGGSALKDGFLLYRHKVAVGDDGYYYVIQANQILKTGHLYFPTHSRLFLYLAACATWAFGNPISTIKALCIILHALLALGLLLLVRLLTGSTWLGLLSATLAELSALHLYLVSEFNSNLCGLTFLVWAGLCLFSAWSNNSKFRLGYFIAGVVCLTAAGFAHVSVLPLLIVFACCATAALVLLSRQTWAYIGLGAISLAWFTPAILAKISASHLPSWAQNSFQVHPAWPVANMGRPERLLVLLASPAFLSLLAIYKDQLPRRSACFFGGSAMFSLLVLLNPFLDFSKGSTNLAGRMAILSYLVAATLAPGMLWVVSRSAKGWTLLTFAVVLLFGAFSLGSTWPFGLKDEYLARREQLIEDLNRHRAELSGNPLVVARPGDQFVVTATLGTPSRLRLPEQAEHKRTVWLLDHVPPTMFDRSMIFLSFQTSGATVLVPHEKLWIWLMTARPREVEALERNNIHLYWATRGTDQTMK